MDNPILSDAQTRMEKSIENFRQEMVKIRTGKASTSLLDGIKVDYYGNPTPLNQVASLSTPEPRLIVIQPWDKGIIGAIEKEIQKSDLGLTPINDGTFIRLAIPMLTEERRMDLVKLVKKYAEDARIAVRNIRRDANDQLKKEEKSSDISEDELKKLQNNNQEITDKSVQQIDALLKKKEEEIMEV
ncbi:ribosome recycling factor [candidate division LCP-89 bacterium B3_LCP]|uniref:Ribosome-recycling factor n=1 Tax=candidate division LCP-89 bacterium B3_LCP TaxID=2012998 RepID=A0A532UY11_UNCL8|nr:MAG: ribosome recycling factor [candidate division LCP-89 bacterium B3_LCP]